MLYIHAQAHAWVRAIHEAWVHCFKHTLRSTDSKDQVRAVGGYGWLWVLVLVHSFKHTLRGTDSKDQVRAVGGYGWLWVLVLVHSFKHTLRSMAV